MGVDSVVQFFNPANNYLFLRARYFLSENEDWKVGVWSIGREESIWITTGAAKLIFLATNISRRNFVSRNFLNTRSAKRNLRFKKTYKKEEFFVFCISIFAAALYYLCGDGLFLKQFWRAANKQNNKLFYSHI